MSDSKKAFDFNFGATEKVASKIPVSESMETDEVIKDADTEEGEVLKSEGSAVVKLTDATKEKVAANGETSTVTPVKVHKKRGRKPKNATAATATETVDKPKNIREEFLYDVMKKAGRGNEWRNVPKLETLFSGKKSLTQTIPLKDIAVFTSEAKKQDDPLLCELRSNWHATNSYHPVAEIQMSTVFNVAVQIMEANQVYTVIDVVRAKDGTYHAISGRHRLVVLALIYGLEPDVMIPVSVSEYSDYQAKDAVIVANQARRAGAQEKAEHKILRAVHGNTEIEREQLYRQSVDRKSKVADFCIYTVFVECGYGFKLNFPVAKDSIRSNALTTMNGLKGFWKVAMHWDSSTTRVDFDAQLRETVHFLNDLTKKLQTMENFKPQQHLSSMTVVAIGKIYEHIKASGKSPRASVDKIAEALMQFGDDLGRQKSEKTYHQLLKILNG